MAEEKEKRVIDFVADLPVREHSCVFNVLHKEHKHRACEHRAWQTIQGYEFCNRHAETVQAAIKKAGE